MFLRDVIKALESAGESHSAWIVAILVAEKGSEEVAKFPIFGVEVQEFDPEAPHLTLRTDQEAPEPRSLEEGLPREALLRQLRELQRQYPEYQVLAGSALIAVDEEHEIQRCSPLIGHYADPQTGVLGLLQGPLENWGSDDS
ncbi:MAG: hypothetical protein K0U98_11210 [Deltaproteobacteria bacterium]|nr:hypothetical protein [Deltaproteobacteria bacterium]